MQPGTSAAASSSGYGPVLRSYSGRRPGLRSNTTQTEPLMQNSSAQTTGIAGPSSLPDPWALPNPDLLIDQSIENFELDHMDEFNSNVRLTLEHSLSHFSQMLPEERPRLPYYPLYKSTIEIIGVVGVYLQPYLDSAHPSRIMSILYCGAIAACRVAGIDLPEELIERSSCNNPYCYLLTGFMRAQVI